MKKMNRVWVIQSKSYDEKTIFFKKGSFHDYSYDIADARIYKTKESAEKTIKNKRLKNQIIFNDAYAVCYELVECEV